MDSKQRPAAHEKPPESIKKVFKSFQQLDGKALGAQKAIIDTARDESGRQLSLSKATNLSRLPDELEQIFQEFMADAKCANDRNITGISLSRPIFEVIALPGLFICPSLLPKEVQLHLLNKLLHRDLANPKHNTNIHLHYRVPYLTSSDLEDPSYFDSSASHLHFCPKDPNIHKPLTTQQFLNKKLRWMTLGGQYDWTRKLYPQTIPPAFPADIKKLIESLFPSMKAEAAIVNLYSPGDTLSLHRDVSEECDKPLVSISLGCDAVFVVGLEDSAGEVQVEAMRLRSGDAVLMSAGSRYAWHGVPKVLEGTCPEWMAEWPGGDGDGDERFGEWRGWMKGKRINVNVRQMFD